MASFRFLHVSDTHLGYPQYGLKQRAVDIARSFKAALEHGVRERVDFILLCGDFFERRDTSPEYFQHATDCLRVPLEAGIPVYAIAGNHDKAYWSRGSSWLDVLNESGYFHLLSPTFEGDGRVLLEPWDEASRTGAAIDDPAGRFRVVGVPHLGNHTEPLVPRIAEALAALPDGPAGAGRPWTVMMMHLGLTGQVPNSHDALEPTALDPLRGRVEYVALGHYHKRYQVDDWVYNPGGTENRSSYEVGVPHGYHLVTVEDGRHSVEFFEGLRRPYHLVTYRVREDETRESLKASLLAGIGELELSGEPLVQVTLVGTVVDAYARLDLNGVQKELTEESEALLVRLRPELSRSEVHVRVDAGVVDRAGVEAEVLRARLPATWGDVSDAQAEALVRGIRDIKDHALRGEEPGAVYALFADLDRAAPLPADGASDANDGTDGGAGGGAA